MWIWKKNMNIFSEQFRLRTRMPSSAWFSLRAGSTGWPVTTRPREYWPPTGSSKYLFCSRTVCSVKLSYCWVSVIDPRTITDVLWKAQFIVLLCLIVGAAIFLLCYKNAGGKLAERLLCATSASPLHTVRLHLNISLLLHTTYLCCIPLKKTTTLGL